MNGVVVSETGPEIAGEESSFKLNPYTEILNRARVKSVHSPQNSISVSASGLPDYKDPHHGQMEPDVIGIPNPKKLLRSAADIPPEDRNPHSKEGWGRLVSGSIMALLVAGVGLASRKKTACRENDIEGGVLHEATPLLMEARAESEVLAKGPYHLKDTTSTTSKFQLVTETRVASPQKIVDLDLPVVRGEEGGSAVEEKECLFNSCDQKEAADAMRKWMKMLRKNRRARRQRRLHKLQRMQRMRLQRLKAARLQLNRKMKMKFGAANDPGLEKRISQEKHEKTKPQRTVFGKDAKRALSLMMRLLRIMLRAFNKKGVRTTT
jgi:hypothetical protein